MLGRIALWLAARPVHAVAAIATSYLTLLWPIGGAILVQTRLLHGYARTVAVAVAAAAVLGLAKFFSGTLVAGDGLFWLTTMGLSLAIAEGLVRTRSLTLTAQSLLLVAALVVIVLQLASVDVLSLYGSSYEQWAKEWVSQTEAATPAVSDLVRAFELFAAGMITLLWWYLAIIVLYLGQAMYQRAGRDKTITSFGAFRELNLGKIIAASLVVASVAMTLGQFRVASGIALLLFLAFFVHGVAVVSWWLAPKGYGVPVLVATALVVVVLPFALTAQLVGMLLVGLSVLGYVDAWFSVRRLAAR